MNIWGIFRAHNGRLVVGYLLGAENFEFRQKCGLWRPFKDGNPHLGPNFATTFFQTTITWVENELFGDFLGSKRSSSHWLCEGRRNF